jgi:hypothetical protein
MTNTHTNESSLNIKFPSELKIYSSLFSEECILNENKFKENFRIISDKIPPNIDIGKFTSEQKKYIYGFLTIAINKYFLLCKHNIIPHNVGLLYLDIAKSINAKHLISSYGDFIMNNWSLINENEDALDYDPSELEKQTKNCKYSYKNIMINNTFTNSREEHCFYLTIISIELLTKYVNKIIETVNDCMIYKDSDAIVGYLYELEIILKKSINIIKNIYQKNVLDMGNNIHDRAKTYNNIGMFLTNIPSEFIIDGTNIKIEKNQSEFPLYQLSTIAYLDILLCDYANDYFAQIYPKFDSCTNDNVNYMIKLIKSKKQYNIRNYIFDSSNLQLVDRYNSCLFEFKKLKKETCQMLKKYIYNYDCFDKKNYNVMKNESFANETDKFVIVLPTKNNINVFWLFMYLFLILLLFFIF